MNKSVKELQQKLKSIHHLLSREGLLSVSPEEQENLLRQLDRLEQRLSAIELGTLAVGLLGGTGVGKSTIMNALAGEEISTTSHRRPHTDRIIIYRYEGAPLPSFTTLNGLPWQEIIHRAEAVGQIILCDLPDFDSIANENRHQVISFLENLDILAWVATPEKYADAAFYEFLEQVPKAGENFAFVLNKADQFFREKNGEEGYRRMEKVSSGFRELVHRAGSREPLLFIISASEALSPSLSPWNQFTAFRQFVFQRRRERQVAAIKAANLDVEMDRTTASLAAETELLEMLEEVVDQERSELEKARPGWIESGHKALEPWVDHQVRRAMVSVRTGPEPLVGPGQLWNLLLGIFRKDVDQEEYDPARLKPPESTILSLRRQLDWIRDRLEGRIMSLSFPDRARERMTGVLNTEQMFAALGEEFFQLAARHTLNPPRPDSRIFRVRQWMVYAIILLLLLFALGGREAWVTLRTEPGPGSFLGLITEMTQVLFSTRGLAALGSYILLNLLFGFRYYRIFRRRIDRAARKRLDLLESELVDIWADCLDRFIEDLDRFKTEIRDRRLSLSKTVATF